MAGKTTFVQEAIAKADVLGNHYVPASSITFQGDIQNLASYYSRPRLLHQGAVETGVRKRMHVHDFSPVSIFTDYTAGGLDRLTGVYGMRYTLVFSMQVAATTFHQGLHGRSSI